MNDKFVQAVYETLSGTLKPEFQVPGVENAFAPGAPCDQLYAKVYDAKFRLSERLGVLQEDADVEALVNAYEDILEYMCKKMYAYGAAFGSKNP